ncbi:MAG TPA: hypothetical protein DCM27_03705 [Rhodospirillaceae bacterium]|nr:hypothetical protein [Rhodospirillaceae bacterium]
MAANNLSVTSTNNDFTGSGTTQLFLGGLHPSNTSQSIGSGNISKLKYYPARPPTPQLQLMTQ